MRILIIGAGGHAQVVADIILCMKEAGKHVDIVGFFDDDASLHNQELLGYPVLDVTSRYDLYPRDAVIVGIGNNHTRRRYFEALRERGETFFIAQHPHSVIARKVEIGPGSQICAGVVVNTGSRIGLNVILNTSCSIDHHNRIGDHCHIAPGARLGGAVSVGEGSLIGIGATLLPQRRVGFSCTVGAGAVVTRPVADRSIVVGVPARAVNSD